jgi:hypothetical protein
MDECEQTVKNLVEKQKQTKNEICSTSICTCQQIGNTSIYVFINSFIPLSSQLSIEMDSILYLYECTKNYRPVEQVQFTSTVANVDSGSNIESFHFPNQSSWPSDQIRCLPYEVKK